MPTLNCRARAAGILCRAAGLLWLTASAAGAGDAPAFRDLFNGRDLAGWINVNTSPQTWQVEDGLLVCTGHPIGVMRSDRQYENFLLEIEWRHMEAGGNSGVFLWSDAAPGAGRLPSGLEVQMLELDWVRQHPDANGNLPPIAYVHGELFGAGGLQATPDNPRGQRSKSLENRCLGQGQWNHYLVVAVDGVVKLSVNGKFVNGFSQASVRKGYLYLESEGAEIQFRTIRILELPGGLADLARDAFDRRWIDAEPREGKNGGGFCAPVPALDESRILVNFDGSLNQVATLAHALGHAFHNHCQRGLPALLRGAPSTLAETASTFCETIVFDAALATAPTPEAQLGILENQSMGATQVIVDIYSRFRFEAELLARRAQAEVSAEDCCALMLDAQRGAYGDGLDPQWLHPYMWVCKPHYYSVGGGYYNFPYAFGLLFGLGIYAVYRAEPEGFLDRYRALLRGTGQGMAADQAARFGIDLRAPAFWTSALAILAERVERYGQLEG